MWQPDVTVAAVCERNGRFLLVEELAKSSKKIVFNQPAGHLEDGEDLISAVVRETLEETCRHFVPEALLGFYRVKSDEGKTYLRFAFCGEISDVDESTQLDPDIIDTHWLSYAQITSMSNLRSELVLKCIDDYRAGVRHPLSAIRDR